MSEMSKYFEIAEKQGAVLLDASNFRMKHYRVITCIRDAMHRISEGRVGLGYDNPGGSDTLRALIAQHESSLEGIPLTRDNVVVNNGGVTGAFDNVLRHISRTFRDTEKKEVVIPIPHILRLREELHITD